MAGLKLGGKIELTILALTLAVQLTKLIREKRSGSREGKKNVAPEPEPIIIKK